MSDTTGTTEGVTGTPEYDELLRIQREAKEQIGKAGKKAVSALFKNFFAANTDVTAIGWTQYTPHFNDGDPCEFGVRDFYFNTKADLDFEETAIHDEEDGWSDTYARPEAPKRQREIAEAVSRIERAVDDDVFEESFGDGVQVIAVPDGFHVTEYSHD